MAFPAVPSFEVDEPGCRDGDRDRSRRRPSTSTTASRSRQDYYDSQRIDRPSRPEKPRRPASWASQSTQSTPMPRNPKRGSYQEPANYFNLDEAAIPRPVRGQDNRPHLEDARGRSGAPTRNFSQRDGVRKPAGLENLDEASGVPPVPDRSRADDAHGPDPNAPDAHASDDTDGPYAPRRPEQVAGQSQPSPPVSRFVTELYTISYLIFFALLGTLARLGVQWLTFYPGSPLVTPVTWANFGGSLIMGFLAEDQALFQDREQVDTLTEKLADSDDLAATLRSESSKRKKTIPLYIGLATGFCGSFTSFSSFSRDVFLALSNNLPTPIDHPALSPASPSSTLSRNGGYSVEALLAVVLYTLALSLGGLIVGAHLALALTTSTPTIHGPFVRRVVDPAAVFLGWGCWLGAIFLTIWGPRPAWRGEVLFALVFAPLGCLLRFYASLKLNALVAAFPLGTFAVNMFGTAVEAMCYDIQHAGVGAAGVVGGGLVGCQVLQGVMDGFCGCLTTVSTFVAEINGLQRKHGYAYGLGSVLGGLCLMIVIMGSVRWSVGWSDPVCHTGYTDKLHG